MYQVMFYGGLAMALFFLVQSIIFFVRNNVAKVIGDITGWNAKRAIEQIQKKKKKERKTAMFEVEEEMLVVHTDKSIEGRSGSKVMSGFLIFLLVMQLFSAVPKGNVVSAQQIKPEITITCDKAGTVGTEQVVCKIKVQTADFDACDIKVHVQRNSLEGVGEVVITKEDRKFQNGEEEELTFREDGIYTVYGEVTNAAGLITSTLDNPVTFTIDKSNPKLSVLHKETGKEVEGSSYNTKEGQKLELKAEDLLLSDKPEDYQVTLQKNTDYPEPCLMEWKQNGYQKSATLMLDKMLEEGQYTVTFQAKDRVGHCSEEQVRFVVDNTNPEIAVRDVKVMYEDGREAAIDETGMTYYLTDDAKVSFKVVEENYSSTKVYVNTEKNGGLLSEEKVFMKKQEDTFHFSHSGEGDYTMSVWGEDAAGNISKPYVVRYVIDRTAPEFSVVTMVDGVEKMLTQNKMFSLEESQKIGVMVKEAHHDISSYQIKVMYRNPDDGTVRTRVLKNGELQWNEVPGTNAIYMENQELFRDEGWYTVTVTGKDMAGNEGKTEQVTFCVDATPPAITQQSNIQNNGCYNEAVRFRYDIYEANFSSATAAISITRKLNGETYKDEKMIELNGIRTPFEEICSERGEYIIVIRASDKANNLAESRFEIRFVVDMEKPIICMKCDKDYSKWSNQDVSFDTIITDAMSGLKEIICKVNGKVVQKKEFQQLKNSYHFVFTASENARKVTGYEVEIQATNNCGTTHTVKRRVYIDKEKPEIKLSGVVNGTHYKASQTIQTEVSDISYKDTKTVYHITRVLDGKRATMVMAPFRMTHYKDSCNRKMMQEGSYKVYAVTTDGAGNKTKSNTLSFVIDKTEPELAISGVDDEAMSAEPVTLYLECVESFSETVNVEVQIEKTIDGIKSVEKITDFPKNRKKNVLEKEFSEDGAYTVIMNAVDQAGNQANTQSVTFFVDCTKPDVQIKGTDNYQQWAEPVTLQFLVKESFYRGNKVTITGKWTDIDGKTKNIEVPDISSTSKISSVSQCFSEDGIYELQISAKDQAGNCNSQIVHFVVDQTKPQIRNVESYNGEYCKQFKLADSVSEIFRDLTVTAHRILLNGIEYNGIDTITEEGKYSLYVEAEDELGHISIQGAEFIIDHTPPKVIFSGVKDSQIVYESGRITLALADLDDIITGVRVNGKEHDVDARTIDYTEYGSYEIEVDCSDRAGNAVTKRIHFVYANPVTVAVLCGGLSVFIIAVSIGLMVRIRRKEERNGKRKHKSSRV